MSAPRPRGGQTCWWVVVPGALLVLFATYVVLADLLRLAC